MSSWLRQRDEAGLEVQRAYTSMLSGKGYDLTPSTKLQMVVQILQEILNRDKDSATKRKVLVYCVWPSLWPIVQAHLRHHGIYTMCIAESSSGRRDQLIAEFQQQDAHIVEGNKSYVAIISAAVSTGINLTRASVIIMMVSKHSSFSSQVSLAQYLPIRIEHGPIKKPFKFMEERIA
jgi:SNF2 family DNA or RNA helicase